MSEQGFNFEGALLGGALGALGGVFSSRAKRKAAERFRINQQAGINEARSRTDERVSQLLDNPLIQASNDFLLESFEGEGGALGNQFQRRLEAAQESRGIRRSRAGAVAEASSLAAFSQQFKASLLPQAQSFGTLGERFRQSILAQETPISIGFHTGAAIPGISNLDPRLSDPVGFDPLASAFQQGTAGALGGFQIQNGLNNQQQFNGNLQLQDQLNQIQNQEQLVSALDRNAQANGFGSGDRGFTQSLQNSPLSGMFRGRI